MTELQQIIEDVARGINNAEQYDSPIVGMSKHEARTLIDAAQLVAPLQDRCQLLGRALTAVWTLVDEKTQREIAELLDVPHGPDKTLPAGTFVQLIQQRDAVNGGEVRP